MLVAPAVKGENGGLTNDRVGGHLVYMNSPLEKILDTIAVVVLACVFAWVLGSALMRWAGL